MGLFFLAARCHEGEPPVDLADSFMALEAVMSSAVASMVPLARTVVETSMSSHCLRHEAFAGRLVAVRNSLV